jgi:GTP-binding protein Era
VKLKKGIVIGHKGAALKKLVWMPVLRILWETNSYELVVKVNKNWRSNTNMLRRFGYNHSS